MGWESVNVADVASPEPVEAGLYTLQLMGAYPNKFKEGATDVAFMITDSGPAQGRKVYLEIPNPDDQAWAVNLYASLLRALGIAPEAGSIPIDTLSAAAKNGHSRLQASVYIETFQRKDQSEGKKNKINSRSFRPAA